MRVVVYSRNNHQLLALSLKSKPFSFFIFFLSSRERAENIKERHTMRTIQQMIIFVFNGGMHVSNNVQQRSYPTDHMSTSVPYSFDPKHNSGDRYHRVTTGTVSL